MSKNIQISLPARIEAILYLKGRPTSSKEMADLLDKDIADVEKALWELKAGYAQRDTALEINESKNYYSLELRQGLGELVQNLLPADLSIATLRTLATVASVLSVAIDKSAGRRSCTNSPRPCLNSKL